MPTGQLAIDSPSLRLFPGDSTLHEVDGVSFSHLPNSAIGITAPCLEPLALSYPFDQASPTEGQTPASVLFEEQEGSKVTVPFLLSAISLIPETWAMGSPAGRIYSLQQKGGV